MLLVDYFEHLFIMNTEHIKNTQNTTHINHVDSEKMQKKTFCERYIYIVTVL